MRRRGKHFRPVLECLEERCLLTVGGDLNAFVVQDEATIRAKLGDLVTLGGDPAGTGNDFFADLGRLVTDFGYLPGHLLTPFAGIGLAFDQLGALSGVPPVVGLPTALLYQPTAPGTLGELYDFTPDAPYPLIGWAYALDYDPTAMPNFPALPGLASFPADIWQVHEAGYHSLVAGLFLPTPPEAEFTGGASLGSVDVNESPGDVPFFLWHERFW